MKSSKLSINSLSNLVLRGRLRFLGKPAYQALIALELTMVRWIDVLFNKGSSAHHEKLNHSLTAAIKTFERPNILRRLVVSIRRWYPNLPVIIVDDSRAPQALPGVETIFMPFDSGVSAGRNRALENVRSEYILILDDDFIFYSRTQLIAALEIMDAHLQIDIMGGQVVDLPFFSSMDYSKVIIFPTQAQATMPPGSQIAGLPVYDKVANFYIARTSRLRLVGWTPELKRLDHADFFTRAKGILTTVYNKNLKCLHARNPYDLAYRNLRYDIDLDKAILQLRYYD